MFSQGPAHGSAAREFAQVWGSVCFSPTVEARSLLQVQPLRPSTTVAAPSSPLTSSPAFISSACYPCTAASSLRPVLNTHQQFPSSSFLFLSRTISLPDTHVFPSPSSTTKQNISFLRNEVVCMARVFQIKNKARHIMGVQQICMECSGTRHAPKPLPSCGP